MTDITEAVVVEPVVDTPTSVDSRLFTDHAIESAISIDAAGLRNLKNPELSVFYAPADVPYADLAGKYAADSAKRALLDIPAISSQEFFSQLRSSTSSLFTDILSAAGLELEIENDLRSDTDLGIKVAPIGQITPENVRQRLQNRVKVDSNHLHLLEKPAPILADTDIDIQDRVNNVKQYLRDYLK
jgi:hypothetical protein